MNMFLFDVLLLINTYIQILYTQATSIRMVDFADVPPL